MLDQTERRDLDLPASSTVQDVAARLRGELEKAGRMIVAVRTDGRDVPPAELDAVLSRPVREYSRLEFESVDARRAVVDALRRASAACAEADRARGDVTELIDRGLTGEAMDGLGECLAVWSASAEALVSAAGLLRIDLEGLTTAEGRVGDWLDRMTGQLRQLREALRSGDLVLTGDILRHELDGTMRGWESTTQALVDAIERDAAGVGTAATSSPSSRPDRSTQTHR